MHRGLRCVWFGVHSRLLSHPMRWRQWKVPEGPPGEEAQELDPQAGEATGRAPGGRPQARHQRHRVVRGRVLPARRAGGVPGGAEAGPARRHRPHLARERLCPRHGPIVALFASSPPPPHLQTRCPDTSRPPALCVVSCVVLCLEATSFMNPAGEKRKAEEAVLQLARPRKVVVVAAATTAKMDPRLLESSTEELNDELARLETQRQELKSALREIKFKMGEIRRLVGARNAAQHMEDFHLQTTIQELRHEEDTISAEQQAFPAAGLRLPYEVILEIFSFLRAADLLKASTVSRAWHTITNDNLLWKHIVTKKWEKYSTKILNDRTSIHDDSSSRDWKKYFRWCESQNLRWASHLDYLTDVAESKRQATLGRKFLARGNNSAALKVLQAANRLVPSEEIESLIKSIQSGDPSVGQRLPEWQCQHCTYINSTSEGSCDMCTLPRFS